MDFGIFTRPEMRKEQGSEPLRGFVSAFFVSAAFIGIHTPQPRR